MNSQGGRLGGFFGDPSFHRNGSEQITLFKQRKHLNLGDHETEFAQLWMIWYVNKNALMLYKLYHIWYHPSKNDEFSPDKPNIFASTPAMGGSSSVQSDGDSRYRVRLVVSSIFNRGTLGCNMM